MDFVWYICISREADKKGNYKLWVGINLLKIGNKLKVKLKAAGTKIVWSWLCRITLEAVHIFLTATSFTRDGDFIVIARFDRELLIEL